MGSQPPLDPAEQYRKVSHEWYRGRRPDSPVIPRDWADDLIRGAAGWIENSETPEWLPLKIANVPNVLLQLPKPDNRWVLQFRGIFFGTFDFRFSGWRDAHDLISTHMKPLLAKAKLEETGMAGDVTLSGSGGSCADSYPEALRKRIERWMKMVMRHMTPRTAEAFSRLFVLENGRFSFHDPGQSPWMTELGEIPFDARMTLDRGRWIFEVPFGSHELILSADKNLKYLARILMCGNIPVPSGLLIDGLLLSEFQNRPPYREYFRRTFRKYTIHAGTTEGGETAQAICRQMRLKDGQWFTASDEIAVDSPLHLTCGVPVGPVTLLPNGIRGVQAMVSKQHFLMEAVGSQFLEIEKHLKSGLIWVARYPSLLSQIEVASEQARPAVSMALLRLRERLMDMPTHWTTPYDELARHFKKYIRPGKLCRYTGTLRWKVEGLDPLPDPVELAIDHMAFKRRAAYQQRRRERKLAGLAHSYVKPKAEISKLDKWNASIRAELAKMQVQGNTLAASAGMNSL